MYNILFHRTPSRRLMVQPRPEKTELTSYNPKRNTSDHTGIICILMFYYCYHRLYALLEYTYIYVGNMYIIIIFISTTDALIRLFIIFLSLITAHEAGLRPMPALHPPRRWKINPARRYPSRSHRRAVAAVVAELPAPRWNPWGSKDLR